MYLSIITIIWQPSVDKSHCESFGVRVGAYETPFRPKIMKGHFEKGSLHPGAGLLTMVLFINLDTALPLVDSTTAQFGLGPLTSTVYQVSISFLARYFLIFPVGFFDPWEFRSV